MLISKLLLVVFISFLYSTGAKLSTVQSIHSAGLSKCIAIEAVRRVHVLVDE